MWSVLNDTITHAVDYVLGWILYLPRDVQLFLVAVLTSVILTVVRLWTTDQAWLKQAADDQKRLKELLKQAKAAKDKDARKRHVQTLNQIKMKAFKFEGMPLLAALVPLVLLGTWAFNRIAYVPVDPARPVEVRLYVPSSAIGDPAVLVPQEGLSVEPVEDKTWIQTVRQDAYPPPENVWDRVNEKVSTKLSPKPELTGVAVWRVRAEPRDEPYTLQFRYEGRTYGQQKLLVGGRKYASPLELYEGGKASATEVVLKPVRLFGWIGAMDFLWLAPWLVAYLLIAVPFVYIIRWAFKIR